MPRFEYAGQHPVPDGEGGVIRPGDIREELPDFGPWTELPDDDGAEKPAGPKAAPVPPAAPARPAAATTPPPATTPAPAAEGN